MLDLEAREREDVTLAWHRPHVDQKISRHGLPADRGGRFARPAFRDRAGPHTSSSRWPLVLVATSCSHVSPWSRYRRAWRWKQPELAGQARAIELAISLAAQSPCLQFSSSLSAAAPPRVQGKKGHPRYRRPSSGWACLDWIVGRALSARLHACMRRSAVVFDSDELMMISPGPVYRAVCFPSHRVLGRIACLTRICKPKTRYWAVLREVRIRWDLKIIGYVSLIRTIPVQSFCLLK